MKIAVVSWETFWKYSSAHWYRKMTRLLPLSWWVFPVFDSSINVCNYPALELCKWKWKRFIIYQNSGYRNKPTTLNDRIDG